MLGQQLTVGAAVFHPYTQPYNQDFDVPAHDNGATKIPVQDNGATIPVQDNGATKKLVALLTGFGVTPLRAKEIATDAQSADLYKMGAKVRFSYERLAEALWRLVT